MREKRIFEPSDPTPVEWPVGVSMPESLEQKIARMVRTTVSLHAAQSGAETFDEANDFDVEDDEPVSPHELDDDQEALMRDLREDKVRGLVDPRALAQVLAARKKTGAGAEPQKGPAAAGPELGRPPAPDIPTGDKGNAGGHVDP